MMYWMNGWHMFWMWGFWLFLVAIVALALVALLRRRDTERPQTPKEILEQRYARGEIDSEEFERRLEHLNASR